MPLPKAPIKPATLLDLRTAAKARTASHAGRPESGASVIEREAVRERAPARSEPEGKAPALMGTIRVTDGLIELEVKAGVDE